VATLRECLDTGVARLRASGSESARLDAELAHAVGADRVTVLAHPDAGVGEGQRQRYEQMLDRRAAGEPVAYIRGLKEFYGLAFAVDARALIPRPETELLVELALGRITALLTGAPRPAGSPPIRVLDMATGSGCVGVTLATQLRRRRFGDAVRILSTDVSTDALELAVENAVVHGVADVMEFRRGDLLDDLVLRDGPFSVIAANLPYVPSGEVPRLAIAASFEPVTALDGGADGLDLVRRAFEALPDALDERGVALFEIGSRQDDAVRATARDLLPGWTVALHADLAGIPRVAEVTR
jgi:release factor glutamine methyltransferase